MYKCTLSSFLSCQCTGRSRVGDRGSGPNLENQKWREVSLELLVWTPLRSNCPITSDERSVRPSLKHVDDFKKCCQDPPGSVHEMLYLIHAYQLIFNQPYGANLSLI